MVREMEGSPLILYKNDWSQGMHSLSFFSLQRPFKNSWRLTEISSLLQSTAQFVFEMFSFLLNTALVFILNVWLTNAFSLCRFFNELHQAFLFLIHIHAGHFLPIFCCTMCWYFSCYCSSSTICSYASFLLVAVT